MLSAATARRDPAASRGQVAALQALELFVFAGLPVLTAALLGRFVLRTDGLFDLGMMREAAHHVLHGQSPYPAVLSDTADARTFRPFAYPAVAGILMAPFAVLPWLVAEVVWTLLGIAAIFGALRLLGVRDWRCYGALLLWPSTWSALVNGSASLVLLLPAAVLWRYRSRASVAGGMLALLVVFKLYFWPLGVWLLATRRIRALIVSVVAAASAALLGWAVIGFAGLREYPHLLDWLTKLMAEEGYSPFAFFRTVGAGETTARLLMLVCGAALIVALLDRARRSDRQAFLLAVAVTFALSPIVWPHYFVLIAVALAVASSELDGAWLLPILAWPCSTAWSDGSPLKIGLTLLIYGGSLAWALQKLNRSTERAPATMASAERRPLAVVFDE
jgi:glycosyl transferase family 87